MPDDLPEDAAAAWQVIVPPLSEAGVLDGIDALGLEAACRAWAVMKEAERVIAAEGCPIHRVHGQVRTHPAVSLARETRTELRAWLEHYGCTPVARVPPGLGRGEVSVHGGGACGDHRPKPPASWPIPWRTRPGAHRSWPSFPARVARLHVDPAAWASSRDGPPNLHRRHACAWLTAVVRTEVGGGRAPASRPPPLSPGVPLGRAHGGRGLKSRRPSLGGQGPHPVDTTKGASRILDAKARQNFFRRGGLVGFPRTWRNGRDTS